jgi:hypothetical protein
VIHKKKLLNIKLMFILKKYKEYYVNHRIFMAISKTFSAPLRHINKILLNKNDYSFFKNF